MTKCNLHEFIIVYGCIHFIFLPYFRKFEVEEWLSHSKNFIAATASLKRWLIDTELELNEENRFHGDCDVVATLIESLDVCVECVFKICSYYLIREGLTKLLISLLSR